MDEEKTITSNKKAEYEYFIEQRFEAGISSVRY
jgi:tmRNA-binding protein